MNLAGTDILRALSSNGAHVVREPAGDRFIRDAWVIKSATGDDLEVDLGGFSFFPVQVPDALFSDLESAQRIRQDGEDAAGNPVYRTRRKPVPSQQPPERRRLSSSCTCSAGAW